MTNQYLPNPTSTPRKPSPRSQPAAPTCASYPSISAGQRRRENHSVRKNGKVLLLSAALLPKALREAGNALAGLRRTGDHTVTNEIRQRQICHARDATTSRCWIQ